MEEEEEEEVIVGVVTAGLSGKSAPFPVMVTTFVQVGGVGEERRVTSVYYLIFHRVSQTTCPVHMGQVHW